MAINAPDWERLLDSATAKLPGASNALLKNELFDVMHEFLDLSSAWMEDIEIPVIADVLDYTMVPSEGQIIRLIGVRDSLGAFQQASMPTFGTLHLLLSTNEAQTFTATVIKTVVLPTEAKAIPIAPDWLLPVYGPKILDGVLGRMMGQISKSYSNPALSLYHLKRFLNGAAGARSATYAANSVGGAAWAFPRQFGRGSQRGGFSTSNSRGF